MNKHLPGCLYFQCLVGCLFFFVLLLLSLSQSPLQHVGCHSIFSYICNNAKSSRRYVFHCVLKFILGNQGRANKMKKSYTFLISNCHIAETTTFGNIFKNSHSISDLLINGIFHTIIHWIKGIFFFSKLFMFFPKLLFQMSFNIWHFCFQLQLLEGWVCSVPESSPRHSIFETSLTDPVDLPSDENILWHLCPVPLWICSFNSC